MEIGKRCVWRRERLYFPLCAIMDYSHCSSSAKRSDRRGRTPIPENKKGEIREKEAAREDRERDAETERDDQCPSL